jgi:hypothetical protein
MYVVLVISTHGAIRTKRSSECIKKIPRIKTFKLPVNMYKIDASKPGYCYNPPTDTFNIDIKEMILHLAALHKDNEPYEKIKKALSGELKRMDCSYGFEFIEYEGTQYESGNRIYNKMYSFNSDEAQSAADFKIELFVSDECGNMNYEDITEEVFGVSNIRYTIIPKYYEILLSSLLKKVHSKIVGMVDYNYILIDLTCSSILDSNNERYNDRTNRLLIRTAKKVLNN